MRRSEQDALVAGVEEATRRLACIRGDAAQRGAVHVHDVLLVARPSVARALENELPAIGAEVRFRVLAAIGQLANVVQMTFGRRGIDDGRATRGAALHAAEQRDGETEM